MSHDWIEVKTADGEIFEVRVAEGKKGQVREAFAQISDVEKTQNNAHNLVEHGTYGNYTRYKIKQHYYGGCDPEWHSGGFTEILEILDAPDGRHPIVLHEYWRGKAQFHEFETVKQARLARKISNRSRVPERILSQQPGFIRTVVCGRLQPWFYAVGKEELFKDYAVPSGFNDHPIYRLGARFFDPGSPGDYDRDPVLPSIKVCMGCVMVDDVRVRNGYHDRTEKTGKKAFLIFWDDGSETRLTEGQTGPLPLGDEQLWIVEALERFRQALQGRTKSFTIDLEDGSTLSARLKPSHRNDPAGMYYAEIAFADRPSISGVFEFSPTPEHPSARSYLRARQKGKIVKMSVRRETTEKAGKKWSGVYLGS